MKNSTCLLTDRRAKVLADIDTDLISGTLCDFAPIEIER
jgi:hypothetical protein